MMPISSNSLEKPEFHQETRLGLVVYGGISLAIYMNGVCQEFFNAVRGRGIYKLIKALTDSDIVVDIISGTSAGGVNGVLLSYALANTNENYDPQDQEQQVVEFRNFARIWRDSGSISELLRQPGKNRNSADSILDGEYYQQELANALKQTKPWAATEQNDWYSPFPELDLFVTGTDVLGKIYQAFDNTGQVIEVKDHRAVFQVSYREGRKKPFDIANSDALAKLCRITSCFPVAFPVVSVKLPSPSSFNQSAISNRSDDDLLAEWGGLADRDLPSQLEPSQRYQLHFVDGGVLDNRPFSYTIRQIYYRTASRPVRRKLLYIDPTPDSFLNSATFKTMARPTIWQSALDSLVNLPRYESIASDLEAIKDHNERVRRYKLLRSTAERAAERKINATDEEDIYLRCRLVGLRDRVLPTLLQLNRATSPTPSSQLKKTNQDEDADNHLEKAAKTFTQYIANDDEQIQREEVLYKFGREVRNLDVEYALRKHLYFLEKIFSFMETSEIEQDRKHLKLLAGKISRQIELLEVIRSRLDWLFSTAMVRQKFGVLLNKNQDVQEYNQLLRVMGNDSASHSSNSQVVAPISTSDAQAHEDPILSYIFCLHRFLLDLEDKLGENLNREKTQSGETNNQIRTNLNESFFGRFTSTQFLAGTQINDWIVTTEADEIKHPQAPSLLKFKRLLNQRVKQLDDATASRLTEQNLLKILATSAYNQFDGDENHSPAYRSVLRKIELDSEELICQSALMQKVNAISTSTEAEGPISLHLHLLKIFRDFRKVDQAVYSYEYLADLHEKNLIEIVRISPDAAQLGFGAGVTQDRKLAGDQFQAFGGFFKKSWRSNDILWGRLDGLNRIVEALITPDALHRFPKLVKREAAARQCSTDDYLNALLLESLPKDVSETEKKQAENGLLPYLKRLVNGETFSPEDMESFLDAIVLTGHRAILRQDLPNVFEDVLFEQLEWNQQAVEVDLRSLVYQKSVPHHTASEAKEQFKALQFVDRFLVQLTTPRQISKIPQLLKHVSNQYALTTSDVITSTGLEEWLQSAYPVLSQTKRKNRDQHESDVEWLSRCFLNFANSIDRSKVSLEWLVRLLSQLHETIQFELSNDTQSKDIHQSLVKMDKYLSAMLETLRKRPTYSPVTGVFDKAVTPFAVRELAKAPIDQLVKQGELELYFRRDYRVAQENLTKDIPPYILNDLTARTGLVIRDILASRPTGDLLQKNPLYQFANYGLQAYYRFVQFSNPGVYRSTPFSRFVLAIVPLLMPLLIGGVIFYFLNSLPKIAILAIVTLAIVMLLYSLVLRFRR